MTDVIRMVDGDDEGTRELPASARGNLRLDLAARLKEQVETEEISLQVPRRPYMHIRYRPEVDYDKLRKWGRICTDKRTKQVDELRLACTVLEATCVGVEMTVDGSREEVLAEDGESLRFGDRELQDMLGTMEGAPGAIKAVYGADGHILGTMAKVLDAAGYSKDDLIDDDEGGGPFGR